MFPLRSIRRRSTETLGNPRPRSRIFYVIKPRGLRGFTDRAQIAYPWKSRCRGRQEPCARRGRVCVCVRTPSRHQRACVCSSTVLIASSIVHGGPTPPPAIAVVGPRRSLRLCGRSARRLSVQFDRTVGVVGCGLSSATKRLTVRRETPLRRCRCTVACGQVGRAVSESARGYLSLAHPLGPLAGRAEREEQGPRCQRESYH